MFRVFRYYNPNVLKRLSLSCFFCLTENGIRTGDDYQAVIPAFDPGTAARKITKTMLVILQILTTTHERLTPCWFGVLIPS